MGSIARPLLLLLSALSLRADPHPQIMPLPENSFLQAPPSLRHLVQAQMADRGQEGRGGSEGGVPDLTPEIYAAQPTKVRSFYEAVALYMARDYENAYDAFRFLFHGDMANVTINFYLGLSAVRTGRNDAAIAAFERVLFAEPKNARAHFELGKVYFTAGLFEQAELQFRRALFFAESDELLDLIERYITAALSHRKRSFLSGALSVGFFHEDNVNQGNDFTYPDFGDEPLNPTRDDTGHSQSVSLNHLYDIGGPKAFYLYTTVSLFARSYTELEDQSFRFARVSVGPFYRSNHYSLSLPLGVEYMEYGGIPYLTGGDVGLTYRKPWGKQRYLFLELVRHTIRHIQPEQKENDTDSSEITGGLENLFPLELPGISLSAGHKTTRTIAESDPTLDNDQQYFRMRYSVKLHPALTLSPSYTYRQRLYVGEQSFWFEEIPFQRLDATTTLQADLLFRATQSFFLRFGAVSLDNRSNHPLYSYRKNRFTFSISYMF